MFLRAGVLSHLDEEREEKLRDQVIRLQAICRGHLQRRHVQKLKVSAIEYHNNNYDRAMEKEKQGLVSTLCRCGSIKKYLLGAKWVNHKP